MKIQSVFDAAFAPYGRVLEGLDCAPLLDTLRNTTAKPANSVIYVPCHPPLEALHTAHVLSDNVYGGMPIQIGYCNGSNTRLNCLEYHRDSEINITDDDMIFLVASQQALQNGMLDTGKVEAFRAPQGTAVELYATTLHYAPCNAAKDAGFRVAVVLPRGTNIDRPAITPLSQEDALLWARNKWLIAHADTKEAREGAFVGLTGDNLDIADDI